MICGIAMRAGSASEEKVQKLTGLGFTRAQCEEALTAVGGDEERAAALLFESSFGF